MRSQTLTVGEGQSLNTGLSFQCWAVVADNLSSSWAWEPHSQRPIPPWSYGVQLPFLASSLQANIQWITPTGLMTPTAGVGQLVLTYVDQQIPYNPGVVTVQAQPAAGTGAQPPSVQIVPAPSNSQVVPIAIQFTSVNTTQVILAATPGVQYVLFNAMVTYTWAGAGPFVFEVLFEDTSGVFLWGTRVDQPNPNVPGFPAPFIFNGALITRGRGLQAVINTAPAAGQLCAMRGAINYNTQ
jgi:hypothetical protein